MVEVTLEVSLEGCAGALQAEDRVDASRPIPAEEDAASWNPAESAQETVPCVGSLAGEERGEAGGQTVNAWSREFSTDRALSHPTYHEGTT